MRKLLEWWIFLLLLKWPAPSRVRPGAVASELSENGKRDNEKLTQSEIFQQFHANARKTGQESGGCSSLL